MGRVARSQKVPILRIRGAARPKNPSLRKRDRRQGFRLRTTPSAAGRAQGDFVPKFPAPTFVRFDACNYQNEKSKLFYLTAGVLSKNLQAGDIPGGDVRLVEKAVKLIHTFDAIALLTGQALTIFAYMIAMSASGEFFVPATPPADSTVVRHGSKVIGLMRAC
jgi:hypothetical protein